MLEVKRTSLHGVQGCYNVSAKRRKRRCMDSVRNYGLKGRLWLLQAILGGASLAIMLTACLGQQCGIGVPAPPPVKLVASNGVVYLNTTNSTDAFRASAGTHLWQEN